MADGSSWKVMEELSDSEIEDLGQDYLAALGDKEIEDLCQESLAELGAEIAASSQDLHVAVLEKENAILRNRLVFYQDMEQLAKDCLDSYRAGDSACGEDNCKHWYAKSIMEKLLPFLKEQWEDEEVAYQRGDFVSVLAKEVALTYN